MRVVPTLALALKATALARMTGTLLETYLGRDAERRVLSGRIMRGIADRIDAVIWFSDLRGFTRITDLRVDAGHQSLHRVCDALWPKACAPTCAHLLSASKSTRRKFASWGLKAGYFARSSPLQA